MRGGGWLSRTPVDCSPRVVAGALRQHHWGSLGTLHRFSTQQLISAVSAQLDAAQADVRMGLADVIDDDPAKLQALLEKFVYIDKDGDGAISLEELQEVYQMFDPNYDADAVATEFVQMDSDDDGSITIAEFLKAQGIDTSNVAEADLERARSEEVKAEEEALRQGVAAVEIVPDGSEAQACVAAVEGSYATVEAAGAVAAVAGASSRTVTSLLVMPSRPWPSPRSR